MRRTGTRGRRRLAIVAAGIVALSVVLAATRPSEDRYVSWVLAKLSDRAEERSPLLGLGLSLFGERMVREGTTVSDYGVIRVFHTEWKGKQLNVAGVAGLLIPLGKPRE